MNKTENEKIKEISIKYICHTCKKHTNILIQNINKINYIKCDKCSGRILHKIRTTNKCQYNCR